MPERPVIITDPNHKRLTPGTPISEYRVTQCLRKPYKDQGYYCLQGGTYVRNKTTHRDDFDVAFEIQIPSRVAAEPLKQALNAAPSGKPAKALAAVLLRLARVEQRLRELEPQSDHP